MFFFKKTVSKINLPYLEVQLVNHCNLNCRACSHFSNIAEPYYYNIFDYENDLKVIGQKFTLGILRLLGGEPLLHPDLIQILKITRKYLPETPITVVTNAVLLPEMNEQFFMTLKDENITVDISVYPLSKSVYEKSVKILESYNIEYSLAKTDKFRLFFNPDRKSDYIKMFKKCILKRCRILYKSKIYHCPICACSEIYSDKFGVKLIKGSGIDFKNERNRNILLKFLTPQETCQYCDFESVKFSPWAISKAEPFEWSEYE